MSNTSQNTDSDANKNNDNMIIAKPKKPPPKRFIKTQIPDSILNDAALNFSISVLPKNYNFEIHKSVWRVRSTNAKHVVLQFPEGLIMFGTVIADIIVTHGGAEKCYILADVTYGACCIDDYAAAKLGADLLIHYGHSCLIPVDLTLTPCLYVFVDIAIDVAKFVGTVRLNFGVDTSLVVAGTIQFGSGIRAAKVELEKLGFRVLVPQAKPLSAGEVLGCTAPRVRVEGEAVGIFVADGRFHLEAFMIANPAMRVFRYDPYLGKLFLEEYDQVGMREVRKNAILKARTEAKTWGIIFGTLGRQGNPNILERLKGKMTENGIDFEVYMMSELTPAALKMFDLVDAWIQIACPRLSIDWGDAFEKPLLTTFEAEIALGYVPGWWERNEVSDCGSVGECGKSDGCCGGPGGNDRDKKECDNKSVGDYPMDYYAQDGGEWNSCYMKKKPVRAARKSVVATENGTQS